MRSEDHAASGTTPQAARPQAVGTLARLVDDFGVISVAMEVSDPDPFVGEPTGLRLGTPDGAAYSAELRGVDDLEPLTCALAGATVVGHDLQPTLTHLRHHYGVLPAGVFDTCTASKLIDGGRHHGDIGYHSLEACCARWLGGPPRSGETGAVGALLPLRDRLDRAIIEAKLGEVARLENAVLPAVADLTLAGVGVDEEAWARVLETARATALAAGDRVEEIPGITNRGSAPQILAALQAAGLDLAATNRTALAPHARRADVQAVLEYRPPANFVSDHGPRVLEALRRHGDGRARARFDPLGAVTGRFSTRDPNLLGLPKRRFPACGRCIVPPAGQVLIVADYAAVQLRAIAQMTGDPFLAEVFQAGGDPHLATAAALLGKKSEDVTGRERQAAKAVNFGFSFGMGIPSFVAYARRDFGVSLTTEEATEFRAQFRRTYRNVDRWHVLMGSREPDEVRSASGRVRYLGRGASLCDRLASPIQGTEADGMTQALVLLHERLPALGARTVLTVHDEVLVEAPVEAAEEVKRVVVDAMTEGMARYITRVPVVVDASIRSNWVDLVAGAGGVGG